MSSPAELRRTGALAIGISRSTECLQASPDPSPCCSSVMKGMVLAHGQSAATTLFPVVMLGQLEAPNLALCPRAHNPLQSTTQTPRNETISIRQLWHYRSEMVPLPHSADTFSPET